MAFEAPTDRIIVLHFIYANLICYSRNMMIITDGRSRARTCCFSMLGFNNLHYLQLINVIIISTSILLHFPETRNNSVQICQPWTEQKYFSNGPSLELNFVSNDIVETMGVLMSFQTG